MGKAESESQSPAIGDNALTDYDTLYDIMTRRLSARRLKPDPLPDGTIEKILEAGRWAMSGANSQPWEYIVVTDPEKKQALFDAYQTTNLEFIFWMEQMRDYELRHPAFQVEGNPEEALQACRTIRRPAAVSVRPGLCESNESVGQVGLLKRRNRV